MSAIQVACPGAITWSYNSGLAARSVRMIASPLGRQNRCRCSRSSRCPVLIERSCDANPTRTRLYANGGYAGQKREEALAHIDQRTIETIRPFDLAGFVILPRRLVVDRILAWLNWCRRLAKDWEVSIAFSETLMLVSSIRRMIRHIANEN